MLWSSSPTTVTLASRTAGQQPDQLELGVVGVLELVDQDVPIAPHARRSSTARMLAQQAQGQAHLVAEIDPVLRAHQPLVGRVQRRQLRLPRRLLGQRRIVRGLRCPGGERVRRRAVVAPA